MKPTNTKKPDAPESKIQKQIIEYLQGCGYFVWQHKRIGTFDARLGKFRKKAKFEINGVSDILGVLPGGKFLAIEVKAKKGSVSDSQKKFIKKVNDEGGMAFVARSVEDVIGEFDKEGYYLAPKL